MKMASKIIILLAIVLIVIGEDQVAVIKSISKHLGNVILECQDEMGFGKDVINEFITFWVQRHALRSKDQGCVVACINKKLEFLEPGGNIKTENTNAFAKANGAGPKVASQLMELYQLCIRAANLKNITDGCMLGLEMAKCFRYGIFQLHWAPNPKIDYHDEMDDKAEQEQKIDANEEVYGLI